jgi:Protein of unknown function (DUF1360)
VVLGLAAARVARAISCDEVTAPLRERLARAARSVDGGGHGTVVRWASELVQCPVCTGWWASLALSAMWPGRLRLRRGLAVAGAQVLITLAERLVSEQGRAAVHEADHRERLAS